MHMRVSAKVEDCRRTLQSKHLALENLAVLAMLVVAQEERFDSADDLLGFLEDLDD